MRSAEGQDYWGKGVYHEIVEPERLVYTDSFSDEEGNHVDPAQYGMSNWPAETRVTVTFAEREGKTEMTLPTNVPRSLAERHGAAAGWSQSFEKLADYLAEAQPAE